MRRNCAITHRSLSRSRSITLAAAAALVFLHAPASRAAVDQWINPAGGSWTIGGNWSTGNLPQTGDTVTNPLNAAISFNTTASVNSFSTSGPVTMLGGTLSAAQSGTAPNITISGLFSWYAGLLMQPSITLASGGIDFHGAGNVFVFGGTLTNAANQTATIGASGNITLNLDNFATFANAGALTATNGTVEGSASTLANSGTFDINEPAGTFVIADGVSLVNSGTTEVQAGTLNLQGGGASTGGTFLADNGATLTFAAGSYTSDSKSAISGAGTVNVLSQATLIVAGAYNVSGTTNVSGGAIYFNAPTNTPSALTFNTGAIGGTGNLLIGGLFTWSGGSLSATATTANGGINFTNGTAFLSNGTLTLPLSASATIGTSGNFYLDLQNGATFANSGSLTAQFGAIDFASGATPTFNNNGLFTINTGGTFTIGPGVIFSNTATTTVTAGALADNATTTNTGRLQASGGTIQIGAGDLTNLVGTTLIGGSFEADANGILTLGNSVVTNEATLTLGGNGSVTGLASLAVNAGTLSLKNSNSFTTSGALFNSGMIAIDATSKLTLGGAYTQSAGQIEVAGKLTLGGSAIINGSGMQIDTGGTIDLVGNTLTINYVSAMNDPATTIRGYLQSAYNNDTWTGSGITSSNAAANPGLYAVGYADGNTDIGTPALANQIIVMNTLAGDANLDGIVNFPDLLVVAQNYGKSSQDWSQGDFNYDGIVNFPDLLLIAQNYGKQLSAGQLSQLPQSFAAEWNLAETEIKIDGSGSVPEPTAAAMFALSTTILLCRRKNRYPSIL